MRPVNGDKDIMSWSFVLGTTDKVNPRKDTMVFLFALEPDKVLTMMDGLDDLTGEEKELLEKACDGDDGEPAGDRDEQEPDEGAERAGRAEDQAARDELQGHHVRVRHHRRACRTGSTRASRS